VGGVYISTLAQAENSRRGDAGEADIRSDPCVPLCRKRRAKGGVDESDSLEAKRRAAVHDYSRGPPEKLSAHFVYEPTGGWHACPRWVIPLLNSTGLYKKLARKQPERREDAGIQSFLVQRRQETGFQETSGTLHSNNMLFSLKKMAAMESDDFHSFQWMIPLLELSHTTWTDMSRMCKKRCIVAPDRAFYLCLDERTMEFNAVVDKLAVRAVGVGAPSHPTLPLAFCG
jgi:hypothetical protein